MLLSVPTEILNKISFEVSTHPAARKKLLTDPQADNQTRRRLRRTCKLLSSVATPLVFQSVYINLSWRRRSSSLFLNSLTSGPKLAQYIIRLSLCLPERFRCNPSRFCTKSRTKKKEERLDSFDELFLGAIPLMVALRSFS